ncbi:unnamed protein product [Linum trigynum]|uniref:Uncharacterized protein n=1 Tax=Linum trigynum TaxID=586398 RepID=A0AAV2DA68_9ROSI
MEAVVRPYGWRRLLCLAEPTYQELVWEFYASFSHASKGSADHADAVRFTLGRVEHSVSYWELASALRLNSTHSSDRLLHLDISDPTDFASQAYFQRICLPNHADEQYTASQTRATLLRPEWRILNHLLTQSYTPSRGSSNRVTLRTLFFMHAMSRPEDTIELGSVLARTFGKASASQDHDLVCGPVITALARYYGVDLTGMTMVRGPTPLSEATLRHQHLVARHGRVHWIAGLPQPPLPAEGDQPESSAAGGRRVPRRIVRRGQAPSSPSAAPRSPAPRPSLSRTSASWPARSAFTPASIVSGTEGVVLCQAITASCPTWDWTRTQSTTRSCSPRGMRTSTLHPPAMVVMHSSGEWLVLCLICVRD